MIGSSITYTPISSSITIEPNELKSNYLTLEYNPNILVEAWKPFEYNFNEPKLNAISCPGCGSGHVKKTNIDGIVECEYCGRQFILSY